MLYSRSINLRQWSVHNKAKSKDETVTRKIDGVYLTNNTGRYFVTVGTVFQ